MFMFELHRHWLCSYIDSPQFIDEICIQLHQSIIRQESLVLIRQESLVLVRQESLVLVIEEHKDSSLSLLLKSLTQHKSGSVRRVNTAADAKWRLPELNNSMTMDQQLKQDNEKGCFANLDTYAHKTVTNTTCFWKVILIVCWVFGMKCARWREMWSSAFAYNLISGNCFKTREHDCFYNYRRRAWHSV